MTAIIAEIILTLQFDGEYFSQRAYEKEKTNCELSHFRHIRYTFQELQARNVCRSEYNYDAVELSNDPEGFVR